MRYLDAAAVAALGPAAAVDAIRHVLLAGLDPALDPPRVPVDLDAGQFLLMPSQVATPDARDAGVPGAAGVKVVTVAPANPARGLPRIQAVYLLFDHETLALRAVLDGTALTTLRTPAVSVAAVLDHLPARPLRLAVVGTGPQGLAHADTLAAVRDVARTTFLARDPHRASVDAVALGTPAATEALRGADVVVCATSARTPVLDSTVLRDDVVVVAVGSHEPHARELDAALLARSTVVVEDRSTAMREAGDVVMAIAEGALTADDLVPLPDLVADPSVARVGRPLVFKSVGMAWQDLVVARAVVERRD